MFGFISQLSEYLDNLTGVKGILGVSKGGHVVLMKTILSSSRSIL
jgi:hypothetical protein